MFIICHRLIYLSDGIHILSCAFQRGPSQVWWQVVFDAIWCLLMCPSRLEPFHVCVYFYKVCDTINWPFVKFIEGYALFLRVSLRFFESSVFGGGSKVVSELDNNYHVIWHKSPSYIIGGLRSCLWVDFFIQMLLSGGYLVGIFSPLGSLSKRGSSVLAGTASTLQVIYQEVFSLTYVIFVP